MINNFKIYVTAGILLASCIIAFNLIAEPKGPGGPPPEIQACKNLKAGDKCSFNSRDGSAKTSTCISITTHIGKELSCGELSKPPRDREPKQQ